MIARTPRAIREHQLELAEERIARVARKRLAAFARFMWPEVDNAAYKHGWHVDAVCEHLEAVSAAEIQYFAANIPPGHMKSLLVNVFWPSWEWVQRPEEQYLLASNSIELSRRDNRKARDLIFSTRYQRHFVKNAWRLRPDQAAAGDYANTARGFRRITSPSSKTTGWRGTRLLVDDLISASDAHSDAVREHANNWFRYEFMNRRNDEKVDPIVVIAQRLHDHDLFGLFRDELAHMDWVYLKLSTRYSVTLSQECNWHGFQDPRTEEGELLFPARIDEEQDKLNQVTLGPAGYAAQHGQDPTPPGGLILDPYGFQFYDIHPRDLAAQADEVILSVDCAFKGKEDSDFVCIQVWAKWGGKVCLLDEEMEKLSFPKTLEAIRRMVKMWSDAPKHGIIAILVEDKANGSAVMDQLSENFFNLEAIEPEGGKVVRAHACAPAVAAKSVYFWRDALFRHPKRTGDTITAEEKARRFGKFPKLENDDDVDAFTQALIWWNKRVKYWWSWKKNEEEEVRLSSEDEPSEEPMEFLTAQDILDR